MDNPKDKKEQVFRDWENGLKYQDIAQKHDIKLSTLKSWASRDFKSRVATKGAKAEKMVATKSKKVATTPKPRGAPKGNRNAEGKQSGAPLRNQHNLKHGAFAQVYWDVLDHEELELLDNLSYDEEVSLEEQIALLTIRERRLMANIKKFKDLEEGINLDSTLEKDGTVNGDLKHGEDQKFHELSTSKISTFEAILKLESALTQVQAKKTKCVETLHKIRTDRLERQERAKIYGNETDTAELDLTKLSDEELLEIESILRNQE